LNIDISQAHHHLFSSHQSLGTIKTVFADKTNGAEGIIASAATATMTSALPPATKRLYVYLYRERERERETSFIINFLSRLSLFLGKPDTFNSNENAKTQSG